METILYLDYKNVGLPDDDIKIPKLQGQLTEIQSEARDASLRF
jgi:hypothetical protein